MPMEVRSVSVSTQVGFPENIRNTFGIVKISQSTSEISQVPVSIDEIPDAEGCPCLPMEVNVASEPLLYYATTITYHMQEQL